MDVFIDPLFTPYYERSPLVLVDVGAAGGPPPHWRAAEAHLKVIGFEPDGDAAPPTSGGPVDYLYLHTALYRDRARIPFYVTRKRRTSSILRPNQRLAAQFPDSGRLEVVETTEVEADTLDRQLREHGIDDVDFIKLDTQGSELAVLEGAGDVLARSVFGLEIEVEFLPLYENQPLFADVDAFVRGRGFQLFDLLPCYWKRGAGKEYGGAKGQIVFADALYLREAEAFQEGLARRPIGAVRTAMALRALSICLLYGYVDYAYALFERCRDVFTAGEQQMFMRHLARSRRLANRIPEFWGRRRIAGAFFKAYNALRPLDGGFASAGRALGNLE